MPQPRVKKDTIDAAPSTAKKTLASKQKGAKSFKRKAKDEGERLRKKIAKLQEEDGEDDEVYDAEDDGDGKGEEPLMAEWERKKRARVRVKREEELEAEEEGSGDEYLPPVKDAEIKKEAEDDGLETIADADTIPDDGGDGFVKQEEDVVEEQRSVQEMPLIKEEPAV